MRFSDHEAEPAIASIYCPIEVIPDNDKTWLLLQSCVESESIFSILKHIYLSSILYWQNISEYQFFLPPPTSPPPTLTLCRWHLWCTVLCLWCPLYQCVCVKSLQLCPTLCTLRTVACQASLSMGFYRQEYWSGFPCHLPGDFSTQGSNLHLLHSRWILCCWATGEALRSN